VEWIPLHKLFAPPYQRSLKQVWARRAKKAFAPEAVGLIDVSHRGDGRYAILNGHQRWNLLHLMGYTEAQCNVRLGQEYEEEARLFCLLNGVTMIRAFDLWRARLEEKDPVAIAISNMAATAGHEIPETHDGYRSKTPGTCLIAVDALQKIYRNEGPKALESVLCMTKKLWPEHAPTGSILKALARIIHERGECTPVSEMAAKFKNEIPTFRSLESRAHHLLGQERAAGKTMGGEAAYYAVFQEILGVLPKKVMVKAPRRKKAA
jgi:hypothetical protein